MGYDPDRVQMNPLWDDNAIQFPRLLAEIASTSVLGDLFEELEHSMDLTPEDLDELFDRACVEWDLIKERTLGKK